ncbi:MAG: hypothetical protein LC746_11900 [Acidobacteria bacterium]|nr:hypothetical protein [Acidobacteriota bacterium]
MASGEEITLTFDPFGLPPEAITAALDGEAINPDPPDPQPTYNFTATVPKGQTHFFKVECDFVGDDDDAEVDVTVEGKIGDAPSGQFSFAIAKDDSIHDPTIRFRVVK